MGETAESTEKSEMGVLRLPERRNRKKQTAIAVT
jgi:hypothetical protein